MPIYMDRHNTVDATREVISAAHERDLAIQGKYGVRFITYWVDEVRSKVFCFLDAPNKDALRKTHDEAHGGVANEIIEVDPALVEAFLGRVMDPPPTGGRGRAQLDSALRAIMFTDLQESSTAMTARLGDAKALDLLHIHNSLTRKALGEYTGREVKHLGDGIMASLSAFESWSRRIRPVGNPFLQNAGLFQTVPSDVWLGCLAEIGLTPMVDGSPISPRIIATRLPILFRKLAILGDTRGTLNMISEGWAAFSSQSNA